ncbi:MAG: hypothetical protein JWP25_8991 [Bradyrhizobium sp.]|nr:hypothetical protein [Bradyrhizobium sp.]
MTEPTDADFDNMHHALGRPRKSGIDTHRNYYCTQAHGPTAQRFEELGWWDFVRTINEGRDAIYCVNGAGQQALVGWMKAKATEPRP